MKIHPMSLTGPRSEAGPARRSGEERHVPSRFGQTADASAIMSADQDTVQRLDAGAAAAKAQQIAEVIRRRRDSGFYHRTEVLHAVTERLLVSGDLELAEPA